jgi:thiol-disulfide isomerase/thioredoxin
MELKSVSDVNKLMMAQQSSAIMFYMNGCGHCERMKPIWSQIAREKPDLKFYKVESSVFPMEGGYPQYKFINFASGEMSKPELLSKLVGQRAGRRRTRRLRSRRL